MVPFLACAVLALLTGGSGGAVSPQTQEARPIHSAAPEGARRIHSAAPDDTPFTVAYYYKVRWGHQQEFERLFLKNHQPILMAEKEAGRIRGVSLYRPRFHGDGRADWTFLVVIQFASWATFGEPSQEAAISRRLFPDQETFKKEEERRFEILDAHWDVPLDPVSPSP